MRVFVTGATGFIGSAVVPELIDAGHEVVGLARSDQAAAALAAAGAAAHRGALDDLDSLRSGAAAADGVIHLAFIHDFSQFESAARTDLRAVETLGAALEGSGRPLVIASGTPAVPGRAATEEDSGDPGSPAGQRIAAADTAIALASRGVRSSVLRLPRSVHGEGDHGFVPAMIEIARTRGVSAHIGDGSNRWPAVHRLDAAQLIRLALEGAPAGAVLHAVADEGIPIRDIAELIGRHLDVPVVSISREAAADHFGWLGGVLALDCPASSALTRERMGWNPVRPGLVADLQAGHYFDQTRRAAA
jgi:nucleoside-diphosphate-sugar epimerase